MVNFFTKNLIIRKKFELNDLINNYPPKLFNSNKKILFKLSLPKEEKYNGEIEFIKYNNFLIPKLYPKSKKSNLKIKIKNHSFDYKEKYQKDENTLHWHLNFADKHLFGFYSGSLFAQDESQVCELPALASLRECLLDLSTKDKKLSPTTMDSKPTPCLIKGVERRIMVDTLKYNIYGNNFRMADKETIEKATTVLEKPTIENIIAVEAPKSGKGTYKVSEMSFIVTAAYTSFYAAKFESGSKSCSIHTGDWGYLNLIIKRCGAYGGNKMIMYILQIISARLAGIKI
jgi:hypothetical protein